MHLYITEPRQVYWVFGVIIAIDIPYPFKNQKYNALEDKQSAVVSSEAIKLCQASAIESTTANKTVLNLRTSHVLNMQSTQFVP